MQDGQFLVQFGKVVVAARRRSGRRGILPHVCGPVRRSLRSPLRPGCNVRWRCYRAVWLCWRQRRARRPFGGEDGDGGDCSLSGPRVERRCRQRPQPGCFHLATQLSQSSQQQGFARRQCGHETRDLRQPFLEGEVPHLTSVQPFHGHITRRRLSHRPWEFAESASAPSLSASLLPFGDQRASPSLPEGVFFVSPGVFA